MDVQPWGYQPVPLCVCTLPGCCWAPGKGREDPVETPVSPVQNIRWFGIVGLTFGCCQPRSTDCCTPRVAGCKVPFPAAPVPRGHSRGQAAPLLCSSARFIWLCAAVSSCSPRGMGHHLPALQQQEWGRRLRRCSGCCSTRSSRPGRSHPAGKARPERKSYCCSHTPAITSQQKAASAQPGESPRTGTARLTFTGRAADRPEP